ncbi:beta-galactosidase [Kribbella sp. NPDC050241]|uniref:beta-galactosidase n=1 Tax=Kribbella sp. NPDC050241 TaxID=3364115 RepID=UPI0037A56744
MSRLTYDAQSFSHDGERIWIVGGEVHYFRHPRAEWRDVLVRARNAGLNTIATYVPWNFHEQVEGTVDFEGDKDLAHYLDLIAELGMWAMVRPGPYICSEWDGGGLPAWLSARPVRRFREDDPVYLAAVESWFGRLLPIVSARQATNGGPVLTVQNENEYPGGWDDSMRRYVHKLTDLFRKHSIDVPILACNVHAAGPTTVKINNSTDPADQILDPDLILTYNHHTEVDQVEDFRAKQPDAPLIVSEFWSGAPHYWGEPVTDWPDAASLARAANEYTSAGTQLVYYMFEGGTNFGFWAGNNIVTSYASGYPVGAGGLLTEKYYAIRPPNLFANQFAEFLADSNEVADEWGVEGARVVARRSSRGDLLFVSTADGRAEVVLTLANGRSLPVSLGEVRAAVLPANLAVFDGVTIDYGNLSLLVRDEARRTVVLYGPAGTDGVLSVNGEELVIPVRRRAVEHRAVEHRSAGDVVLVVVDEEMARRCWLAGGQVVFGPDYVGDGDSLDVMVSAGSPPVVSLDRTGRPVPHPCEPMEHDTSPPELSGWRESPAGLDPSSGWLTLAEPVSHERLGVTQGYVWYAAEVESAEAGVRNLLLTQAPNRVSVWVNGTYNGTHAARRSVRMRDEYAHPADWAFEQLPVTLAAGTNRLVFLSDDLGHNYDVPVPVGIQGPVFAGSRRIEIAGVQEIEPQPVSAEAFGFLYDTFHRTPEPLPAVEFDLTLGPDEEALVVIHGVHAWVHAGGVEVPPMSFPESPWTMFSAIKRWLSWQIPHSAGKVRVQYAGCSVGAVLDELVVTVRVQYTGCSAQDVLDNLAVYAVPARGRCVNWQWRRWEADPGAAGTAVTTGAVDSSVLVLLPAGARLAPKNRVLSPSWFETRFPMPAGNQPVYLDIGALDKGQIFLNGRNAGRYWRSGGAQQSYYLPRSWMSDDNRLVVFDELGCRPHHARLVYGDAGRWTEVRLSAD